MKIYAPNYLKSFHCIADKCRHSCCIGWDIYIDDDTLNVYNGMVGALGERIRANTAEDEYGTHFVMDKEKRCPGFTGQRNFLFLTFYKTKAVER